MRKKFKALILATLALLAVSCEKAVFDEDEGGEALQAKGNVTFRVTCFEQLNFGDDSSGAKASSGDVGASIFTRAAVPITDLCSRIDLVVFSGSQKVESVTQSKDDEDFGNVSITLEEGTYKVVVIGHNGLGKATISSTEKITFADNKVTDTFSYYGELVVSSETQTVDITLKRVVAMFRLKITDTIPDSVSYFKFYYTGGSSTMSAVTGYGVVESRQTEIRSVVEGQSIYEVYTIPHADTGTLKMTISAYDASNNLIKDAVFESVPITVNRITQCSGDFFSSGSEDEPETPDTPETPGDFSFSMTADGEWGGTDGYNFTYN